ncbi:MAG: trimethylamine methyltransferase family protein [Rhodobacteraceae bacterium]|nr:trimethylamine methyltransferase family protein [Paracoccaceae bacterium]
MTDATEPAAGAANAGTDAAAGARRRRRGGGREAKPRPTGPNLAPWSLPRRLDRPTEPLSEEQVERIHDAAMRILEEIGVDFLNQDAVAELKRAGCVVEPDGFRVKMRREFVMEMVAKAPSEFTLTPRNPERCISIGGDHVVFTQVASPPNVSDLARGRRVGDQEAYRELLMLAQSFPCIHLHAGYPVEPVDVHSSIRHLDAMSDMLTLSDKVTHAYSLGSERIEDAMEMVRLAAGQTEEAFAERPHMFTNINSSSPLKHDWPMLDGAMRAVKRGQMVVVTPFTLSGAMAPVTLAGAIAQQTAEAVAGVALLQWIKPGAPMVYGAFTTNVDMKSGAPAFGTPEYMRAMQMSGQMARYYGLPLRASNTNAATALDMQSAWESVFSLWGVISAGANIVYHGAGWMEGGLVASMEKVVIDCELIQQVMRYLQPVSVEEADLALDAIREVGPNGHFLGCAHTQERYKTAFYSPFLSDWSNYEAWAQAGAVEAPQRAHKVYRELIDSFTAPPMPDEARGALEAFVARRKEEGGAPTDF